MLSDERSATSLSRRRLLRGTGIVGAAALTVLRPAFASSRPLLSGAIANPRPADLLNPTSLASTPNPGYIYKYLSKFDFFGADARVFAGYGVFYAELSATCEVPQGWLFREIEWYVTIANSVGMPLFAGLRSADNDVAIALDHIDPAPGVIVHRTLIEERFWGPYPSGAKIDFGAETSTTGPAAIIGARAGFSSPRGQVGLNSLAPVKPVSPQLSTSDRK